MSFDTPLPPYNASDPHAMFINSSCLDLLLIELVPMAHRLAHELSVSASDTGGGLHDHSSSTSSSSQQKQLSSAAQEKQQQGTTLDEEDEREAVFLRLESLGYRVGLGLVERFARDKPRFTETLDVIKFLCKDLWTLVFRKQVDNLKTNHRGVYVVTDTSFKPFSRMSTEVGGQAVRKAQPFLWFPCGVIRGALAGLGIEATVHAETTELPAATFQIKTVVAKV